jgi:LmbE family N-acetylglucosaminyl deacetylase
MSYTLVSFHAHPDDEALLTGGTLARAAAEGHRVVLVVATKGEAGLADDDAHRPSAGIDGLGARRLAELQASAAALGCARVEVLGYPDSGSSGTPAPGCFATVPVEEAAERLAAILTAEHADVLTIYDSFGGYGHPDHVQVHRVGLRAAELAGTAVVLEATADRRWLLRAAAAMRVLARVRSLGRSSGTALVPRDAYTDPARLTHRVDVRSHLDAKRASMTAHASQRGGGDGDRTLAIILRLPRPMFRVLLGHEWFVQRHVAPTRPMSDDVFASLRSSAAISGAQ